MLGDFSLGLSAAMVRKAGISVVEAGINQAYELVNHLDVLGSDCTLQLCSWHAAEAFKARLIKEGYPKEVREEKDVGLHSLIWNWIKSPSVAELNLNREILAASPRPKEQDYHCQGLKEIDSIWVILKESKSWGEKKEERKLDTSCSKY